MLLIALYITLHHTEQRFPILESPHELDLMLYKDKFLWRDHWIYQSDKAAPALCLHIKPLSKFDNTADH